MMAEKGAFADGLASPRTSRKVGYRPELQTSVIAANKCKDKEIEIMIESRCGILCSACAYREQMGCKGCVHICKPFWGDSCPVKSCCEEKEHEHCGECDDFPCNVLKQFAYDEKQGDNGKRIKQCRCWSTGK